MNFQTFLPHPALRPYIQCYAEVTAPLINSTQPRVETAPPLPAKAIMFWWSNHRPIKLINSKKIDEIAPTSFIVPQASIPNTSIHYGGFLIFAVQFWPGQMRHFFKFPWLEVLDYYIPILDTGDQGLIDWSKRIEDAQFTPLRNNICNHFFLSRLPNFSPQIDRVQFALNSLLTNPKIRVHELAKSVHICERQFNREYRKKLGINPSQHRRLIRFLRATRQLQLGRYETISSLAHQWGYSDTSHMTRDFKFYTNSSPRQLLNLKDTFNQTTNWREDYPQT